MSQAQLHNARIPIPMDGIRDICLRYGVAELSVFGSVLRDDFREDSDVDFLVVFRNDDAGPWMTKFADLEAELSALLKRPVDVVCKGGVQQSPNPIRRRHILESAQVVYDGT